MRDLQTIDLGANACLHVLDDPTLPREIQQYPPRDRNDSGRVYMCWAEHDVNDPEQFVYVHESHLKAQIV